MDLTLTQIINNMTSVVVVGTPIALVLFVFFWNLAMLTFDSANPEKMKQARARVFWSVVGMFVVFSLAGILTILQMTFFGSAGTNQQLQENPAGSGRTILDEPTPSRPPQDPCLDVDNMNTTECQG